MDESPVSQEPTASAPEPVSAAATVIPTQTNAAPVVGLNGPFPPELAGWNWGAFLLTWIWGVGHSVWIALVVFLSIIPFIGPLISLGMAIYLGMKGNELAWQYRKFESIEQFHAVEKAWTKWGIILVIIGIVLGIIAVAAMFALSISSGSIHGSESF